MTYVQPPFWYSPGRGLVAVRAVSVLVTAPVLEPLTLTEAKLRAGLDWTPGDARDGLMTLFIAAARTKVEHDTGLALLTQTRDVLLDRAPTGRAFTLPAQSMPLQSVTSVTSIDSAGATHTLAPAQYLVDTASGRIGLAIDGAWPSDLRPFQPITIRIVCGWTSVALIPAPLVLAVGLLTAHYATAGRDALIIGTIATTTPYGYDDIIAPYETVHLH